MKYLLLFVLAIVGLQLLKRRPPAPTQRRTQTQSPEAMLECRRCGVLVPSSRAVRAGGHIYCCDEHAQQA